MTEEFSFRDGRVGYNQKLKNGFLNWKYAKFGMIFFNHLIFDILENK